ncbi:hypothetical protein HZH66_002971 [Vespula vulgaris]|uniref:Uncharacterized protein n=1 Tax=Vespula vulgaris TaxID=7454 RepID=A0A836UZ23_VESVU|nr:hypothetical protein HZH66_002971 [Vespula vulgaris]
MRAGGEAGEGEGRGRGRREGGGGGREGGESDGKREEWFEKSKKTIADSLSPRVSQRPFQEVLVNDGQILNDYDDDGDEDDGDEDEDDDYEDDNDDDDDDDDDEDDKDNDDIRERCKEARFTCKRRQCTYQVNATDYVTISSLAAILFNSHLPAVQDDVLPSTSEDAK